MSPTEVTEKLQLSKLKDKIWYVVPSCATTGEGLFEGLVSIALPGAQPSLTTASGLAVEQRQDPAAEAGAAIRRLCTCAHFPLCALASRRGVYCTRTSPWPSILPCLFLSSALSSPCRAVTSPACAASRCVACLPRHLYLFLSVVAPPERSAPSYEQRASGRASTQTCTVPPHIPSDGGGGAVVARQEKERGGRALLQGREGD